ncbi:uncharacterized protein LOC124842447 isoform X1 [Vigna umbellata]|uniref:uncharacterized protein LOC124842447 isoform X1 n=1 Tax=Vigna umbellata TaxID=87088 RepID=UPI001F5FB508|nr:uncharacterized protein LOC124842447 isoform X1 [Vigna umbellata]
MDAESEKRAFTSTSVSRSSSCEGMDRLVDKEEMEAAETLAQLAMRDSHSTDKWCTKLCAIPEVHPSPTLHSDPSLGTADQAIADQQQDEKVHTTASVETERTQQNNCSEPMEVEQDANLIPNSSHAEVEQDANLIHNSSHTEVEQDANLIHNSSHTEVEQEQDSNVSHKSKEQDSNVTHKSNNLLGRYNRSRKNLTEEEKEARRMRRILANRESARQTIRRRQALCEELTKKAATLVVENESLKKEKDLALKEYQSLETTNKYLKAQIAKSTNTEEEKTPVEPESSVAEVTPSSGSGPWFLYNPFPVQHVFWPSPLQPTYPVHLPNASFNPIIIPSIANVPCSSESELYHKQNNLINDKQTPNPFYMFPCPWIFPCPQFGNGQSSPSCSLKDKQNNLSLGKPCSSSSSLNTLANVDYRAWTEARLVNDPARFSLDGGEKKTGCHIIENYHGPSLGCNAQACASEQENELQLHSGPNNKASSTAYIGASSVEKKQKQFICQGKSLADAVAAAEARKRRKELTKQKSIHSRQSRMQC